MISDLVTPRHLCRKAVIYIRQSTPHQVLTNQESLRLQYALRQRARDLGWIEADVEVIDADLGQSGAAAEHRRGFKDLIARVTLGEVGLILSYEGSGHCPEPARAELLGLVSATRPVRLSAVPHWRSRGRLRSGLDQRAPSPGPEGDHLRGRTAHAARSSDRWTAEQGRARRLGVGAAGGALAQRPGHGDQGPGSCRAGLRGLGVPQLSRAVLSGQGDAQPARPWAELAAA
jgi:Resolvase, N terminal domain